jgi:hypothetical protein
MNTSVGIPARERPTPDEFLEVMREGSLREVGMALHDTHTDSPSKERRLVEHVSYANGDILNGGFLQYLDNSGADAPVVASELEQLGLAELAAVVREAHARFSASPRASVKPDHFADHDSRWYRLGADLDAGLLAYARQHAVAFLPVGM